LYGSDGKLFFLVSDACGRQENNILDLKRQIPNFLQILESGCRLLPVVGDTLPPQLPFIPKFAGNKTNHQSRKETKMRGAFLLHGSPVPAPHPLSILITTTKQHFWTLEHPGQVPVKGLALSEAKPHAHFPTPASPSRLYAHALSSCFSPSPTQHLLLV
jgi:hypothetical protein